MGLGGQIVSEVLTKYRADISSHKAAIKKLSGEEKKRHQMLLEQTEKQNAKIEGMVGAWGKVAIALGAVTAAAAVLNSGLDTLQRNTAPRSATVGVNLNKLRSATSGLATDTELLVFASKTMRGEFKLSQAEMELALQGARALRKTYAIDLKEAMERSAKALREGSVEPLKDLVGTILGPDGKTISSDTKEGAAAALAFLAKQAREVGDDFEVAGDKIQRAKTDIANSVDSMKESAGELAVAFAPTVDAMGDAFSAIARGAIAAQNELAGLDESFLHTSETAAVYSALIKAKVKLATRQADEGREGFVNASDAPLLDSISVLQNRLDVLNAEADARKAARLEREAAEAKRISDKIAGAGRVKKDTTFNVSSLNDRSIDGAQGIEAARDAELLKLAGDAVLEDELNKVRLISPERLQEIAEGLEKTGEVTEELKKQGPSLLSQVLGTDEEITAKAKSIEMLQGVWGGFEQAFGSGIRAMIDGSESFASAFKKSIASTLTDLSISMAIDALHHGAQAVAAYARYDYQSGAQHTAAAGLYTAGAVAAGVAANKLGAGGAGTPQGTAGIGAAGGSQRPSEERNDNRGSQTTIVLLDDDFLGMPKRQRRAGLRGRLRGAGIGIEGDVVVNG